MEHFGLQAAHSLYLACVRLKVKAFYLRYQIRINKIAHKIQILSQTRQMEKELMNCNRQASNSIMSSDTLPSSHKVSGPCALLDT